MTRVKQVLHFAANLTQRPLAVESQSKLAPVFIVGSGRSGNTLIRRVLMASNQIYIPPETYVLKQIITNFSKYNYLPWLTQIHLALGAITASQDFKYFPGCNYHQVVQELVHAQKSKRTCADLLDALYRSWASSAGMDVGRWGDKTPLNAFSLHEIQKTFPHAQFIYTQRSVYDMVASCLQMGRYATATEAAHRWLNSNIACLEFRNRNHGNVFTVRYEDVVSEPATYFSSLFDFLSLSFKPDFLETPAKNLPMGDHNVSHYKNIHNRISQDSINSGRRRLSAQDMQEISDVLKGQKIPDDLAALI